MSGILKVGGTTLASHSDSTVSLDSGVVIPETYNYVTGVDVTATDQSYVTVENTFPSTYDFYDIRMALKPVSDDVNVYVEMGYGGGSTTWINSGTTVYYSAAFTRYVSGTGSASRTESATFYWISIVHGAGNAATDAFINIKCQLQYPSSTAHHKTLTGTYSQQGRDNALNQGEFGSYGAYTNALTAIRAYAHSGNIKGSIHIYGIKTS